MVDSWQSAVCGAFAGARDYIVLGETGVCVCGGGDVNVKMLAVQNSIPQEFQIVR